MNVSNNDVIRREAERKSDIIITSHTAYYIERHRAVLIWIVELSFSDYNQFVTQCAPVWLQVHCECLRVFTGT